MRKTLLFFCFIIGISSCIKDRNLPVYPEESITSFSFLAVNNPKLQLDVIGTISNDTIIAYLPLGINADSLIANFSFNGDTNARKVVTINSVIQVSGVSLNDYSQTSIYKVVQANYTTFYTVIVRRFTGLPIIYLTTNNDAPIISKYAYVQGSIVIDPNNNSLSTFSSNMEIQLHGNSTLQFPKLPYKIKLSSAASLLGMPAQKSWILLANYSDKTLIRNYVSFRESQLFDLPYTPRSLFAEVLLNGVYVGNYQLTEEIEIDPNRVNINEMSDNDVSGSALTGGYLLEFNEHVDSSDTQFFLNSGLEVAIHNPGDNIVAQTTFIQDYMQQTEDTIFSANFTNPQIGYRKYLNLGTLIKWFWANELMKNPDANNFYSSVWMYKDENDILNFGPVWDFDISAGNVNYADNSPEGWWVKDGAWMARLFQDTVLQLHNGNKQSLL